MPRFIFFPPTKKKDTPAPYIALIVCSSTWEVCIIFLMATTLSSWTVSGKQTLCGGIWTWQSMSTTALGTSPPVTYTSHFGDLGQEWPAGLDHGIQLQRPEAIIELTYEGGHQVSAYFFCEPSSPAEVTMFQLWQQAVRSFSLWPGTQWKSIKWSLS